MVMYTSVQSIYVGCLLVDTSVGTNHIHFGSKNVVSCLLRVDPWMDVLVGVHASIMCVRVRVRVRVRVLCVCV